MVWKILQKWSNMEVESWENYRKWWIFQLAGVDYWKPEKKGRPSTIAKLVSQMIPRTIGFMAMT